MYNKWSHPQQSSSHLMAYSFMCDFNLGITMSWINEKNTFRICAWMLIYLMFNAQEANFIPWMDDNLFKLEN